MALFDAGSERVRRELITRPDALTSGYQANLVGRKAETEKVAAAIRPVIKNRPPQDVWLYGPVGSGKSTVARHVLGELAGRNVKTVYVNGRSHGTHSAIFPKILNDLEMFANRRIKPVDEHLGAFERVLGETSVVLCIDEFDTIEDPGDLVYRLKEVADRSENYVAVIAVSTVPPSEVSLSSRGASRFEYVPVEFSPYSEEELISVFQSKVDTAFADGAVDSEAVAWLADHVASNDGKARGDVRRGLQLLRCAGLRAERQGRDQVAVEDLERCLG